MNALPERPWLLLIFPWPLAVAWLLLRCHHAQELPSRHADGSLWLRCSRCGHERPNLLWNPTPAFRRTMDGKSGTATVPTGIERMASEELPITDDLLWRGNDTRR